MTGGVLTLFVISAALLSTFWTPWSAYEIDMAHKLNPPSATHWLGTDVLGRDIVSLLLVGASTSIVVGIIAVGIGLLAGVSLGADCGRPQGMARGTDHAARRFYVCVSGAALRNHAGCCGGAWHGHPRLRRSGSSRSRSSCALPVAPPTRSGAREFVLAARARRQGQIPHQRSSTCCPISSRS